MTIRQSKLKDHWHTALSRNYDPSYDALEYTGLRSVHDEEIHFSKGITVIVGGNGVGKSTLAHAAVDVLTGSRGLVSIKKYDERLRGGYLSAHITEKKQKLQLSVSIDTEGKRIYAGETTASVAWLDPSDLAATCQRQIRNDASFADFLEQNGPRTLTKDELFFSSNLVGKQYTCCTVWEIPDYADTEVLPYFRVTSNGATYSSESMGAGELSLFICAWFINRTTAGSIIVIEEPETHVSPRSQDALMDLVAWACATRGISVVITTHSPAIIKKVPISNVRLLATNGGKSSVIQNPTWHQVGAILGGGASFRGLLLVEDTCAFSFTQSILEAVKPDLAHQLTIAVAPDGESQIETALKKLPQAPGWPVIGVFDGDQRNKKNGGAANWPYIFLPGCFAPEHFLRQSAETTGAATKLTQPLQTDVSSVTVALNAACGLDHHDWLKKICQVLNRSEDNVVRALTRIWLESNMNEAEVFVQDLQAALNCAQK